MGIFRSGFLACLVFSFTAIAQQPNPGVPTPGVPDTNAPVIPPTVAPEVDPNILQPAPTDPALTAPPATTVATPKPKPKPKAPVIPSVRGTVGAIDKVAMTIVVHGKSKDETLKINSKTRIFADNKPAILADAKDGENVLAEYRTAKDKTKEALTLYFGKLPVAAKKPVVKKKTTPITPAPVDAAAPAPTPTDVPVTPDPNAPQPVVPDPNAPAPNPGTPATNP